MSSLYVEVLPLAIGAAISPGVLTLELLLITITPILLPVLVFSAVKEALA
jgi:hypothetical protein